MLKWPNKMPSIDLAEWLMTHFSAVSQTHLLLVHPDFEDEL